MAETMKLELTQEWDKTFPKSEKVNHRKVTFHNRYGITLAADLYELQCLDGKKHVHLRWGQSFFQSKTRSNASSK